MNDYTSSESALANQLNTSGTGSLPYPMPPQIGTGTPLGGTGLGSAKAYRESDDWLAQEKKKKVGQAALIAMSLLKKGKVVAKTAKEFSELVELITAEL